MGYFATGKLLGMKRVEDMWFSSSLYIVSQKTQPGILVKRRFNVKSTYKVHQKSLINQHSQGGTEDTWNIER